MGHYPRPHGEQTGARLSVVARSLLSLATVYWNMVRDARRLVWLRRRLVPADRAAALVTLGALAASVLAYLYFADQGMLLAYKDANSHLLIARRVVDSPTSGLAQLGGVWLPLPHLLSAPLSVWQPLYFNGLAGAVISMAAYVVATRFLYLHVKALTGSVAGGLAAAGIFALNANILYLQATAMTELLLFACCAAAVHYLHLWCVEDRLRHLACASGAVLAASLTRYEGWILCAAAVGVVALTALLRHRRYSHTEGSTLIFSFVACSGILAWMAWNLVIFGDPMNWRSGEYADSSLWVSEGEANVGSLDTAAQTYGLAVLHNLGPAVLVLGAAGLVVYLVRHRFDYRWITPYLMLGFAPFFVFALYTGQRPPRQGGHGRALQRPLRTDHAAARGRLRRIPDRPARQGRRRPGPEVPGRRRRRRRGGRGRIRDRRRRRGHPRRGGRVPRIGLGDRQRRGRGLAARAPRRRPDADDVLRERVGHLRIADPHRLAALRGLLPGVGRGPRRSRGGRGRVDLHARHPGSEDDVWEALWGTDALDDHYDLVYDEGDRLIYRTAENGE
ncbi:hypothetical protein GCM10029992_64350 [Glycomyces albus]